MFSIALLFFTFFSCLFIVFLFERSPGIFAQVPSLRNLGCVLRRILNVLGVEVRAEMFNLTGGWALVVIETCFCHPVLLLGRSSQVIP